MEYRTLGTTGLKVQTRDAIESRMGDVVGFFLHDDVVLDGTNAIYRIVDIRFGRIMNVVLTGGPKNQCLVLQPAPYTGPEIVVIEEAPSSGGLVGVVFLVR